MSEWALYFDSLAWWQVALLGVGVTLAVLTVLVFLIAVDRYMEGR